MVKSEIDKTGLSRFLLFSVSCKWNAVEINFKKKLGLSLFFKPHKYSLNTYWRTLLLGNPFWTRCFSSRILLVCSFSSQLLINGIFNPPRRWVGVETASFKAVLEYDNLNKYIRIIVIGVTIITQMNATNTWNKPSSCYLQQNHDIFSLNINYLRRFKLK